MRAIIALVLVLAGCSLDDRQEQICTAVGCVNGLRVAIATPPAEPYRVDATAGSDTRTRPCATGGPCLVLFPNFLPRRATIAITAASGAATYDVTPQQSTSRPNGPACDPVCTDAAVTVSGVIGVVNVYKWAGSVQCSGGGLTPAQMQLELTGAGIGVVFASCGLDGNAHIAVCGAADGRINIFEIGAADVAAAQALGFALLSNLPNATRINC